MKWPLAANKLHSHAVCGRTHRGQRSTLRMLGPSTWEKTAPDQRCKQCDEKAHHVLALDFLTPDEKRTTHVRAQSSFLSKRR